MSQPSFRRVKPFLSETTMDALTLRARLRESLQSEMLSSDVLVSLLGFSRSGFSGRNVDPCLLKSTTWPVFSALAISVLLRPWVA